MRARYLPEYLANWTASFTASRTIAFCFDGNIETLQPCNLGPPQDSPVSLVLFLVYAQAMLETPGLTCFRHKDVSYLDDGALQLATTQTLAVRRLQDRMALRLERGSQLNLPYDTSKAGLIHSWPS